MVEFLKPVARCSGEKKWENWANNWNILQRNRLGTFQEAWPRKDLVMHLIASDSCFRLVSFTRCCHWFTALGRKDKLLEQSVLHTSQFQRGSSINGIAMNKFLLHQIFIAKEPSFNPAPNIYAWSKKNSEMVHKKNMSWLTESSLSEWLDLTRYLPVQFNLPSPLNPFLQMQL